MQLCSFFGTPCPPLMTTDQSKRVYWRATTCKISTQHISIRRELDAQLSKVYTSQLYLPLISQRVSSHLSGHTLLIESTELTLIINFNQLLAASSGK